MLISENSSRYQPGVALDDLQLIIEKTPSDVWDALRGKTIFITGGTGFVGCWLLEALLWANQQLALDIAISVLTRDPEAFIFRTPHLATHHSVKLIKGDVRQLEAIDDSFDIVIHAATDVIKPDADPLNVYTSIVEGTQQTLELTRRCGATRYLLTSSGAVYGQQPVELTHIPETYLGAPHACATSAAYGQGKRVSEWLSYCYAKKYKLKVQVARCFALIGPYLPLNSQFAVGNFIRDGLNNNDVFVNGDGTAVRSYLYAADMVIWLLTILVNGENEQPYNVGSDQQISIRDLAKTVSQLSYQQDRVNVATRPSPNATIQRYVPNISKAKTTLSLDQYTNLSTAIQKTIAWQLDRQTSART